MARPPDRGLDAAITRATLELVGEIGVDRLSISAVAERAGTARTSVYRRWPDKNSLVLAAVRRVLPDGDVPDDTGSLRSDLLARMSALASALDGGVLAGLIGATRDGGEVGELVRSFVADVDRKIVDAIVERAVARGELRRAPDDVVASMPVAALFWHVSVLGQPLTDDYLVRLVDGVVLPLFRDA